MPVDENHLFITPRAEPDASRFRPLVLFYQELAAAIASFSPACRSCGECCYFDLSDHILFASALERDYLATAQLPAKPDADSRQIATGERCPYQKDGKCSARRERVLGCRLHFCRLTADEKYALFCEHWHQRLKQLHEELNLPWDYRRVFPLSS